MSSQPRPTVPRAGAVTLPARPENLPINPRETALIVVDMQNAYASPGGYLDLAGFGNDIHTTDWSYVMRARMTAAGRPFASPSSVADSMSAAR